jgi:hypothetical protein
MTRSSWNSNWKAHYLNVTVDRVAYLHKKLGDITSFLFLKLHHKHLRNMIYYASLYKGCCQNVVFLKLASTTIFHLGMHSTTRNRTQHRENATSLLIAII